MSNQQEFIEATLDYFDKNCSKELQIRVAEELLIYGSVLREIQIEIDKEILRILGL